MLHYILGGALIVLGALCATLLRRRIMDRNTEIKFMKTTALPELAELLAENAAAGLEGYRHYAEVKGAAASAAPEKTPYSEREVAYFDASIYQVFEETEGYTDSDGVPRTRTERKEELMARQKSVAPLRLAGDGVEAEIELSQTMRFDALDGLNKFEPAAAMGRYGFFSQMNYSPRGVNTLGYRMAEKIIPLGQPLYVLAEAWLEGGALRLGKPMDRNKPFIVSVKSETDLVEGNRSSANAALYGGIALAVAGVLVIIFIKG